MAKKLRHKGAGVTLANKIYKLAQNTIPHALIINTHNYI